MTKPHFFYLAGTSFLINIFELNIFSQFVSFPGTTIKGLNGQTAYWDGIVANNPFPSLLNPDAWEAKTIGYPAALFPGYTHPYVVNAPTVGSANIGANRLWNAIHALPSGTPYCLGGYSQGAFSCTLVMQAMRAASSPKLADFKGAVMWGNPCREQDVTWPAFGGYPGGLWSGSLDVEGSTTGGHGIFPSFLRMTNTPETWFEFVGGRTDVIDIVNSVSSTTQLGTAMTNFINQFMALDLAGITGTVFTNLNLILPVIEVLGYKGHGAYADQPPPLYAADAPTSYQLALEYLESIALGLSTAPIVVPPTTTAGWSTTLVPPAA